MNEHDKEQVEAYRRGIESGVMKSATPNVVVQLIELLDAAEARADGLDRRLAGQIAATHTLIGDPVAAEARSERLEALVWAIWRDDYTEAEVTAEIKHAKEAK